MEYFRCLCAGVSELTGMDENTIYCWLLALVSFGEKEKQTGEHGVSGAVFLNSNTQRHHLPRWGVV